MRLEVDATFYTHGMRARMELEKYNARSRMIFIVLIVT